MTEPRSDEASFKGKRGLPRLMHALMYSFHGLRSAYRSEQAFRQELLLALVLIPVAAFLDVSVLGKVVMIGSVVLVLIIELLNSAIEAAVDRISSDLHPLAKRAKDMGSAAVFLSLVNVAVVWLVVLITAA